MGERPVRERGHGGWDAILNTQFAPGSMFRQMAPTAHGWECSLGVGEEAPGALECIAQSCQVPRGTQCTTVVANGTGAVVASLPAGYVMVSGGVMSGWAGAYGVSGWPNQGHKGVLTDSKPQGEAAWSCAIGVSDVTEVDDTPLECAVRGCQLSAGSSLDCRTIHNANENAGLTKAECPTGYRPTGCGITNRYPWPTLDTRYTYEEAVPYVDPDTLAEGCSCDMGEGNNGVITCHARCCKLVEVPVASTAVVSPPNTTCAACPVGQFASEAARSFCDACPSGKTTTGMGSTNITDCV